MKNTNVLSLEKQKVAFESVYKEQKAFIRRTINTFCYNMYLLELKEDIEQETFITIFNKLHQFDSSKGNMQTWLYMIIYNKCRKAYNKKKEVSFTANEYIIENISFDPTYEIEEIENKAEISNKIKKVNDCISKIAKGQRKTLEMYLEGYLHDEIADYFNITANTSKSQVKRAKDKVKELYYQL